MPWEIGTQVAKEKNTYFLTMNQKQVAEETTDHRNQFSAWCQVTWSDLLKWIHVMVKVGNLAKTVTSWFEISRISRNALPPMCYRASNPSAMLSSYADFWNYYSTLSWGRLKLVFFSFSTFLIPFALLSLSYFEKKEISSVMLLPVSIWF